ncbi:ribonuclease S-1-like [Trifolium pratense]|uniref:ribonuclease S-1-like n=1 Tax=Trifolium pratense TaxID=57577 RepID=UPI001E69191E|nr:ribonuclease S-1-like [Trifolium pratense]
MASSTLIVFITILCSCSLTFGSYQYLHLVLQWAPAQCRVSDFKCTKPAAHDKFTVHGIWPSNFKDPQPRDCKLSSSKDQTLDMKNLPRGLVNRLTTLWPSLTSTDEDFWRLQWKTHGTCSFSMFGQAKYFWLAVNHWEHMNIFEMLREDGIVPTPGKMFDQNDIIEAIKKHHFHGQVAIKPEFHCRPISQSGSKPPSPLSSELLEIRLCVDHDGFNYFNCTSGGNCGQKFEWFI